MAWLTAITVGGCIAFAIVVARALRSVPYKRPNFEEKELTSTAYDYNPKKKVQKFYIRDNGVIVKRELCQC